MEKSKLSIMILTARFGEGHLQASRALMQSFLDQGIEDIWMIDLLEEAHPLLNNISKKMYITSTKAIKYGIDYYGWSYYMTRKYRQHNPWRRYFNYLGEKKLREMIEEKRPNAIINVFPFAAAPEIAHGSDILSFTVLTDYALHSRWVHPGTDKYYVATPELKAELLTKGFEQDQIEVTGIPIRPSFYHISNQDNPFKKVLHPDKKTVLIAGGAYGVLSEIEGMIQSLLSRTDCQMAIVCGRNERMASQLREDFAGDPNVHIFGFIDNMQELMALSSCIVTKAGGLTLTEALTLSLPVFIYKPFGGQEKENALFFEGKGIARISYSVEELEAQLLTFLSDGAKANAMQLRMAPLHQAHAADRIVKDILQTMTQSLLQPV
ncbi:MGDG synthase family glycosyltransferase [Paenibacillus cremeus]|uniref:Glycosyltransferase n=1 Tax=Paenibacillus cremeus TaxID=2163881 RepID=A0A559KAK7_9BACL|nr:glycosyltransferase [Paenibacillus cremeus]TVY09170.1 glycosyltransferase [Paenibacillus cremeus]